MKDLGVPKLEGCGASAPWIVKTLKRLLGGAPGFTHYALIDGEKYSARVLATVPIRDSVPLPLAMPAEEMAEEIIDLTRDARYDPPAHDIGRKGWAIYSTTLDGKSVTLIRAIWYAGP